MNPTSEPVKDKLVAIDASAGAFQRLPKHGILS